jgi:hypothetical protein
LRTSLKTALAFGQGKKEPKLERMLQKLKVSDPRLDIIEYKY